MTNAEHLPFLYGHKVDCMDLLNGLPVTSSTENTFGKPFNLRNVKARHVEEKQGRHLGTEQKAQLSPRCVVEYGIYFRITHLFSSSALFKSRTYYQAGLASAMAEGVLRPFLIGSSATNLDSLLVI